jgi:hypothetical protein
MFNLRRGTSLVVLAIPSLFTIAFPMVLRIYSCNVVRKKLKNKGKGAKIKVRRGRPSRSTEPESR